MSELKTFTADEVSKHNKEGDLWIIIHGNVYDVSKFEDHPGSDVVFFQNAGKDATEGFEDEGHSTAAKKLMKDYLIGRVEGAEEEKEETIDTSSGAHKRAGKGHVSCVQPLLDFFDFIDVIFIPD